MATVLLAAMAAAAPAAVITQNDPADSLANADWKISYDGNGPARVGLRADYLSALMIGSPIILQFRLDANDLAGSSGRGFQLVNYDNLDDPNATIRNSTGVPWTDFHILLVNLASLPYLPHADANFVDPTGVVSSAFGSPAVATSTRLEFVGGPVPSGGTVSFADIVIDHNGAAGGIFYLKLIPTPEPGTLALVFAGAVGLVRLRRKRA
jgi:hypothetical protein